jgi:DNA-binding response OmpR family regulator
MTSEADGAAPGGVDTDEVLVVQDVELDRAARRVRVRGQFSALPPKEFELLELLMLNAGRAMPRETLHKLWSDTFEGDDNTVDVHILRLRRKIEADRRCPRYIRTLRGFGYIFDREPMNGPAVPEQPGHTR